MRSLNHMFQESEKDAPPPTAAHRKEVIEEINALLTRHGLTVEDIVDF
jgi:hypothetical protein